MTSTKPSLAARIDAPRSGVDGKAVERRHCRDGCDHGARIGVEHDDTRGRAHPEEEAVAFLIEGERHVFLDPRNGPFGHLRPRLAVEHNDLRLFRHKDEYALAMVLDDAAARMSVGGEGGHLRAARDVEYGEIALLLIGIASAGADVHFFRPRVITDRVGPERHVRGVNHRKRGPVQRFAPSRPRRRRQQAG